MHIKHRHPWLTSSLLFALLIISRADGGSTLSCPTPHGASAVSYPAGTPPALLSVLKEHLGDMALPGEPFDAPDVVATGRHWRLIFIWRHETRWVVATEHGGIGYNNPVLAYDLGVDEQTAMLIEERVAFPQTLCKTATALLTSSPRPS